MKQHITVEQLNELSDKGKELLKKWWKKDDGDKFYGFGDLQEKYEMFIGGFDGPSYDAYASTPHKDALPLLSIGQMIEFLEDIDFILLIQDPYNELHKTNEKMTWGVYGQLGFQYHELELCDALWEAVKEVLDD